MSSVTGYVDTEHKVTKLVAPHFSKGLLSLESFVQILERTSLVISKRKANRLMPVLTGHVNKARKAFDLAKHRIHEINDELNSDFEATVVQEKTANDKLLDTQDKLRGINQSIETKQDEENQIQQQLSREEDNLRSAKSFLKEKKKKLAKEKTSRNIQAGFTAPTVVVATLFGALAGPVGTFAAGSAAAAGMGAGLVAFQIDVDNANDAVDKASSRLNSTRRRLDNNKKELSNLRAKLTAKENKKRETNEKLESIKQRKEQIKQLQKRLAKVNDAIKSCTTFVDTTALRTKMMADEANGQLPDIEMMLGPLKAIADDLGDASMSNNRLLCGDYNMRSIGRKIKMISTKAQKSITTGNTGSLSENDF